MKPESQPLDALAAASAPSFSTTEVARLLKVSTQTVQKWVDQGHLAAWKTLGGHRRISVESVRQFVTSQTVAAAPHPPASASRKAATASLRVLVVDDDEFQLELLSTLLKGLDRPVTVEVASNGFAALMMIGKNPPDLLVTDIAMNGMDGLEMLRFLHQNPASARLPAIAVSGLSAEDIQQRGGLPAGVPFLAKPAERQQLLKAMEAVLPAPAATEVSVTSPV